MISEEDLVKIETAFENSKAKRFRARLELSSAKGQFHSRLVARREAGLNLTVADIKAFEDSAIEDDEKVRSQYLNFVEVDVEYRKAKVEWESAKRMYWDSKGQH